MPQGEYPRIANKDEILRMYDSAMMQYVNFLARKANIQPFTEGSDSYAIQRNYIGKIDILRNILGFNGNMEDK